MTPEVRKYALFVSPYRIEKGDDSDYRQMEVVSNGHCVAIVLPEYKSLFDWPRRFFTLPDRREDFYERVRRRLAQGGWEDSLPEKKRRELRQVVGQDYDSVWDIVVFCDIGPEGDKEDLANAVSGISGAFEPTYRRCRFVIMPAEELPKAARDAIEGFFTNCRLPDTPRHSNGLTWDEMKRHPDFPADRHDTRA